MLEVPLQWVTGEEESESLARAGSESGLERTVVAGDDAQPVGRDDAAGECLPNAEPQQPPQPKGWPSRRLPRDVRYFVMKSFSMRDIMISLKKGIWATQYRNEAKLNSAYTVCTRRCCADAGKPPLFCC